MLKRLLKTLRRYPLLRMLLFFHGMAVAILTAFYYSQGNKLWRTALVFMIGFDDEGGRVPVYPARGPSLLLPWNLLPQDVAWLALDAIIFGSLTICLAYWSVTEAAGTSRSWCVASRVCGGMTVCLSWRRYWETPMWGRLSTAAFCGNSASVARRLYRGYLSLCFDWDYYAGHRGKLPLPTRPEVLRDPATKVLLNAEGTPILGAVIKDDEGRPRKDRGGNYIAAGSMPAKAWNDPRAVRTGRREPNPEIQRYRVYEVDDLVRLCYPVTVYDDQNTRRQARLMARRAIEVIEEKGGCIIEPLAPRGGAHRPPPWRILPPDLDGQDDSTRAVRTLGIEAEPVRENS